MPLGSEIFYVGTFGTPEEASKSAERLVQRLRGKFYRPVAKRKTVSRREAVMAGRRGLCVLHSWGSAAPAALIQVSAALALRR
jgi:hypothetical protein